MRQITANARFDSRLQKTPITALAKSSKNSDQEGSFSGNSFHPVAPYMGLGRKKRPSPRLTTSSSQPSSPWPPRIANAAATAPAEEADDVERVEPDEPDPHEIAGRHVAVEPILVGVREDEP